MSPAPSVRGGSQTPKPKTADAVSGHVWKGGLRPPPVRRERFVHAKRSCRSGGALGPPRLRHRMLCPLTFGGGVSAPPLCDARSVFCCVFGCSISSFSFVVVRFVRFVWFVRFVCSLFRFDDHDVRVVNFICVSLDFLCVRFRCCVCSFRGLSYAQIAQLPFRGRPFLAASGFHLSKWHIFRPSSSIHFSGIRVTCGISLTLVAAFT